MVLASCDRRNSDRPGLVVDVLSEAKADALVAEATAVGLTRTDAAGRILPALARSWRVSDDGSFIVFRLRPVAGSAERLLTATDVARSLAQARASANPATRELLAGVSGVLAPLEDVVELRLSTPQPEILELLAWPELAIQPARRGRDAPRQLAGPFALAEPPAPGVRLLNADPAYFDAAAVGTGSIELRVASPADAVRRFARGETDIVLGGFHAGISEARVGAPREALVLSRARATLHLAVNRTRAPFHQLGVRQALERAVDRAQLARAIYGTDAATPILGLTPPGLSGYPGTTRPDWADLPPAALLADARRRLAEADLGEEGRLRVRLAIGDSVEEERIAATLVAGWSAIGAGVVVERRSASGHARALAAGDFDVALASTESRIDSPVPFLLGLRCGANPVGLCLPEADRLLASGWEAPTLAERMARIALAERLWQEDVAAIPLIQPLRWALVAPGVRGFEANPGGVHPLATLRRAD
jgi:ABC-type oligopeptide transport system substrate-binding subunit